MRRLGPPRAALWLLGQLLPGGQDDPLIGDLVEEHALRTQSEPVTAVTWWCWRQALRSTPPLAWAAVRRAEWIGAVGAAAGAAYALVTAVESAGEIAVSRLLGPDPTARAAIGLAIGLPAMVLGGWVAARLRRGAATALAIMIAVVVLTLMVAIGDAVPLWYQAGFLLFGPLAALAGGALRRRRHI